MRCPAHEVRYSQPIGPTPLAPQRAEPVTPRRAAPSLPVTATSLLSAAHVQLAGVAMIRDVTEFRRTGVASRRVAELDIPVAAWRAAMCHASTRRPRGRRTTIRRRRAAGRARDVRAARGACGSSLRQPWTTGGPHAAVDHWRTARSRLTCMPMRKTTNSPSMSAVTRALSNRRWACSSVVSSWELLGSAGDLGCGGFLEAVFGLSVECGGEDLGVLVNVHVDDLEPAHADDVHASVAVGLTAVGEGRRGRSIAPRTGCCAATR